MNVKNILWAVILSLFAISCSRPPRLQTETDFQPLKFLFNNHRSSIRGGGGISIAVDGERYSGSADVKWKNSGVFRADFYSPFGTLVASVNADSVSGTVFLDDKEYVFRLEQTMDSLPFIWGRHITFRQFGFILTGQVPQNLVSIGSKPDTIVTRGKYASVIWKTDQFEIDAKVSRRSSDLDLLRFSFIGQEHWNMQFSSIKEGLARSIEIKEDDRNYFSIRYERLHSE